MTRARISYENAPAALRQAYDRVMAEEAERKEKKVVANTSEPPSEPQDPPVCASFVKSAHGPKMTKTERKFYDHLCREYGAAQVRFEPVTIRLECGHRYTPDFLVIWPNGDVIAYEVKGSYRLHSYGRARIAHDQARREWPMWTWYWAELQKDGTWRMT